MSMIVIRSYRDWGLDY